MEQRQRNPLRLEDVEEFQFVKLLPRIAITDEIRAGVRKLDEDKEIERFLREILPDRTKTPHNSSEIADILTPHVTVAGQPRLAAFVNKGKSFPKVTSTDVSHQILRLHQIRQLGIIVLLAVGHIQDNAVRDFVAFADLSQTDYMIVDIDDVARLFIGAHKICPKDGTPYENGKCRKCSASADEPTQIHIDIFEKLRYDILSHHDISDTAKRYYVNILTDPHYTKETVKEVIKTVTLEIRQSNFYGSEQVKKRFGRREAGCVFLFVYIDRHDIQTTNWICRTSWIDSGVPEIFRSPTSGDDWVGDIQIDWNKNYEEMRKFWLSQFVKKETWTQEVEQFLPIMNKMVQEVEKLLEKYKKNEIGKEAFYRHLTKMVSKATRLNQKVGEQGFAPPECKDCEEIFQCMVGSFYMIFIPFIPGGQAHWDWEQKLRVMQDGLQKYTEEHREFLYEWKRIGKW